MKVEDAEALHASVDRALATGPARVEETYGDPGDTALLCVVGADGTAYWLAYTRDGMRLRLIALRRPRRRRELIYGHGCDHHGFRVTGEAVELATALIGATRRAPRIVRGTASDFAPPAVAGRSTR
jgi:hypothetical protein